MKNYMGVIESRRSFHQDIPTCLADITRFMKPRLCMLDAMRILTAHGPEGGNLADVQDDAHRGRRRGHRGPGRLGAELLGHKPETIGSVAKAEKAGLGTIDYRSLALREMAVS